MALCVGPDHEDKVKPSCCEGCQEKMDNLQEQIWELRSSFLIESNIVTSKYKGFLCFVAILLIIQIITGTIRLFT